MLSAGVAGFALSMGLILAIGPQNIFVLRQGLLRSHVFAVCLVCSLADALLIAGSTRTQGTSRGSRGRSSGYPYSGSVHRRVRCDEGEVVDGPFGMSIGEEDGADWCRPLARPATTFRTRTSTWTP